MTLLDPDAGEILDRLSILARKRLEKPEREHFAEEEEALLLKFSHTPASAGIERVLAQLLRLAAVNMALWQTEDDTRRVRKEREDSINDLDNSDLGTSHTYELGELAIRLQTLNEERSRLVQFFNAELGRGAVEEKDFKL